MQSDSAGPARRRQAVNTLFGVALAASGTLLLVLGSRLSFFYDDWDILVNRRELDVSSFLDPHNEHIVLIPVAIYKVLLATFGMSSSMPFRVVSTAVFLISAVLLFVYLRSRVGQVPALLASVLILFLGPAWEDLLWPFQVGFFGSMAAGLGMLLALERDDRLGDRAACALLTVSMAFSSLGLAFAAGAFADQLLSRRRALGRAYVVAVPVALFAIWWLGWGRTAESFLSVDNALRAPDYVATAIGYAAESLLGLTRFPALANRDLFRIGGLVLASGVAVLAWRGRPTPLKRIPRDLWIVLAIGGAFWILGALNVNVARGPTASRYQYPSAIFLLLICAELLREPRIGRWWLLGATVVTAAALASNISSLRNGYSGLFLPTSRIVRADQAAIEIARDTVAPDLFPSEAVYGTPYYGVPAGQYLDVAGDLGSPAYSPAELVASPEYAREAADRVLAEALGIGLDPVGTNRDTGPGCRVLSPTADGETGLRIRSGTLVVRDLGSAGGGVLLGRFAEGFAAGIGFLPPGGGASLTIPADRSDRPWRLGLIGSGPFTVCRGRAD